MFSIYKRHNNKLYNKLVELSRNKFFYQEIKLSDNFESRILLIFFHLAMIFRIGKKDKDEKKTQEIFDNIFINIEYHIRELGYGDVAVNKKMKILNKIFKKLDDFTGQNRHLEDDASMVIFQLK